MQYTAQSRRSAEARDKPSAAIPSFRKLAIPCVVAASAWPRRPEPQSPRREAVPQPRADKR